MLLTGYRSYGSLICPIRLNRISSKMWQCSYSIWMPYLDVNEIHSKNGKMGTTTQEYCALFWTNPGINNPHKTASVRPLASHLTNYSSKINDVVGTVGEAMKSSKVTFLNGLMYMVVPVLAGQLCVTRNYISSELTKDATYKTSYERLMRERERERERESGNSMVSTRLEDEYDIYIHIVKIDVMLSKAYQDRY